MALIKVVPRSITEPYKKREGDFSPNLVGLQFTDQSAAVFTFGNFNITTNPTARIAKDFVLGGQWSEYYSLNNLNITPEESKILESNNFLIKLNFDTRKVSRYAYFGSLYNELKASVEGIIKKWKGSIYLNPTLNSNTVYNTVLNFNYDTSTNVATFAIPVSVISNPFQLTVEANGNFSIVPENKIFNLSLSYNKYVISNEHGNFPVIGYIGSNSNNQYLSITTRGNPFPDLIGTTFGPRTYHLRPNNNEVELFFSELTDLESILLNRLVSPKYTYTFDVPLQTENGTNYIETRTVTWPVSDGYNIDINTDAYADYVTTLFDIGNDFDKNKTNLVSRRFVAESIHEYDTNGGGDEVYGMKVTKLLKIYGREFDEVKKYIDGISFANVVTYNKLDNTSDELIKLIAKNLGFDVLLTTTTDNFNLLQQNATTSNTPFSGYSRSLSAKELDIELWRRLVINAWWLFRSKGTRKVLEFFFNLFKIPSCMVSLNEYIYLAENRLNSSEISLDIIEYIDSVTEVGEFVVDNLGFPSPPPQRIDNYFQNDGFWYNGGSESTDGNNPHFGPYDVGEKYMNQFRCIIPNYDDFNQVTTITVDFTENFFTDFNEGSFSIRQNGLPVPYYDTGYENVLNSRTTNATIQEAGLVEVGDTFAPEVGKEEFDYNSMRIDFVAGNNSTVCQPCSYPLEFALDGIIYTTMPEYGPLTDEECCYNDLIQSPDGNLICYWCPPQESIIEICSDQTRPVDGIQGTICTLLKPNGQNIINKKCCEIRGGTLVQRSDGVTECIKIQENCAYVIQNHVYLVEQTLELLSEDCCTEVNGYWANGYVDVYDNTGTFLYQVQDIVGSSVAIGFGTKLYCSSCPQQISLNSNFVFDRQTNSDLTEDCCDSYGFTYLAGSARCTNCPTPRIGETAPYELLLNNTVDPNCCQVYGGYYYAYSTDGTQTQEKCWSCPNINDTTIDINNIITYNGSNLSQQCCNAYAALTNQSTSHVNKVCYRIGGLTQTQTISLDSSNIVYVTSDGKLYGRRLENAGNTQNLGDYSDFLNPEDFLLQLPSGYIPVSNPQNSPSYANVPLALTNNRLWVMNQNGTKILQYNIALNPFTANIAGEIILPTPAQGLFATSDNTLLTTLMVNGYRTVVELFNLTLNPLNTPFGVAVQYNTKFTLTKFTSENNLGISYYPSTAKVVQIILTPSTNKLIVLTRNVKGDGQNQPYIFQYNYGSDYYNSVLGTTILNGGIEMYFKVNQINTGINTPYGLFGSQQNSPNTLYTFNYLNSDIWKVFRTPQSSPTDNFYNVVQIPNSNMLSTVSNLNVIGVTQLPINLNAIDFTIQSSNFYLCSNNVQGPDPSNCAT